LVVSVAWFNIAVTILEVYCGIQGDVTPDGWKTEGFLRIVAGHRNHNRCECFTVERQRGWILQSDTAYGTLGKVGRRYVVLDALD
jgi:hypothetical protein